MLLETACEKLTTELIQALDELPDGVSWYGKYQIIYLRIGMAAGVGYNKCWKRLYGKHLKPVLQMTKEGKAIKSYPSIRNAADVTGINWSGIRKVCQGLKNYNTAGGFKWKYLK